MGKSILSSGKSNWEICMTTKSKSEYIISSFAKIKHKPWELYVITRIFHLLDDLSIEFICQQPIKKKNGSISFVDMFFPQIDCYLEIDESHHLKAANKLNDSLRKREILEATQLREFRIAIFNPDGTQRSLNEINKDIRRFVQNLIDTKRHLELGGNFIPWDAQARFDPENYLRRGYIQVSSNVALKSQVDVLKLFGANFKGYQRGWWKIKDTDFAVWFPRLYASRNWNNVLSDDGLKIEEQKSDGSQIDYKIRSQEEKTRIVFGRYTNALNDKVYRFTGIFKCSESESNEYVRTYNLVADFMDLKQFNAKG